MTDGQHLLAEYAATGSEAAFQQLVACYVVDEPQDDGAGNKVSCDARQKFD